MTRITFVQALCLAVTAAVAVASVTVPASARWGDRNDHNDHNEQYRGQQGWNGNGYSYQAPPVVYQPYNNGYYAPPTVFGSGLNLNINLP